MAKFKRFTRYDGEEISVNPDTVCNVSPAGEGESYITYVGQPAQQSRVKGTLSETEAALSDAPIPAPLEPAAPKKQPK